MSSEAPPSFEPAHTALRPPSAARAIGRSALHAALRSAVAPIVWLHAPSGAGKTLGLASFVARRARDCFWYTLDVEDRDPGNLVARLGCALAGELGAAEPPRLPPIPETAFELEARRLFRLLLKRAGAPIWLVLDNFQAAEPATGFLRVARGLFDAFCEAAPDGSRLWVTSRTRPPPALSRFTIEDKLALVSPELLEIRPLEARKLLTLFAARGTKVSDAQVDAVMQASGGWTAAAALWARQGGVDAKQLGSRTLVDYVSVELLAALPRTLQRALAELAFSPRVTASLLATHEPALNLDELTQALERAGVPHAIHSDGALCLHDLVRDALRSMFLAEAALDTTRAVALLGTLAAAGQLQEAVELANKLNLHAALAEQIKREAPGLLASGRSSTLDAALQSLSVATIDQDPWLLFWQASCALIQGRAGAKQVMQRAFDAFVLQGDLVFSLLAACGMIQATLLEGEDFGSGWHWVDYIERNTPPGLPLAIEARLRSSCLKLHFMIGHGDAASVAATDRTLPLLKQPIPPADAVSICADAMVIYLLGGRTEDAKAAYRQAERLAERASYDAVTQSWLLAEQTLFALVAGELDDAVKFGEQALELATSTGATLMVQAAAGMSATAARAVGRGERAKHYLSLLEPLGRSTYDRAGMMHTRAGIRLDEGDLDGALSDSGATAELARITGFPMGERAAISLHALALLALGRFTEARAASACVRNLGPGPLPIIDEVQQRFVEASCDLAEHGASGAREALQRALSLARQQGYYGGPGYYGREQLRQVVAAALALGIEPEFARGIVRRKRLAPPTDDIGPYWPWPVTIRSLGAFSVTLARPQGRDKTHAPTALLELLIARRGEALPIAQAARELWPSRSSTASRSAFDTAVHRLRRALGDDTLVALEDGAIRLAREHIWVDVWALEPLAASIERLPAEASAHDVERLACRLLDLYQGPFGSGTASAASARCRDKSSRRFLASVNQLSRHLMRLGLPRAQADLLERAALRDDACKHFAQAASEPQLSPARGGPSPSSFESSREPDAGPL